MDEGQFAVPPVPNPAVLLIALAGAAIAFMLAKKSGPVPVITSISPNPASLSAVTYISISGSGFQASGSMCITSTHTVCVPLTGLPVTPNLIQIPVDYFYGTLPYTWGISIQTSSGVSNVVQFTANP